MQSGVDAKKGRLGAVQVAFRPVRCRVDQSPPHRDTAAGASASSCSSVKDSNDIFLAMHTLLGGIYFMLCATED